MIKIIFFSFFILIATQSDNKLIGLWESVDDTKIKYLNFNIKGDLFEIDKTQTLKKPYTVNDNFLNIKKDNGDFQELLFNFSGDTLIIQKLEDGKVVTEK